MRPLASFCMWLVLCVAPGGAAAAWPASGLGVDGPGMVSALREAGHTPRQAWHYLRLLDVFAGPAASAPGYATTAEDRAWQVCRKFGAELQSRQTLPAPKLHAWERAARQALLSVALAAQRQGQGASFVVGCGMSAPELMAYLNRGTVVGEEASWTWEALVQRWPSASAFQGPWMEPLRARLGLRWLRVSAWQVQTPAQRVQLEKHLWANERALRGITRWDAEALSLGGRVALDISERADMGLAGQVVYAPGVLLLRGHPDEIPHEWLHALDHALAQRPGHLLSEDPASSFSLLLDTLRNPPAKTVRRAHPKEVSRTRHYLHQALPDGLVDPWRFPSKDNRATVEALSRQGAMRRDAWFLGSLVWQLQASPKSSWVRRREQVAAALVQGQAEGWVQATPGALGSPAYIARPAEILASHFAGVLQACTDRVPAYPLQAPTCIEARSQRQDWERFFLALPAPAAWPATR